MHTKQLCSVIWNQSPDCCPNNSENRQNSRTHKFDPRMQAVTDFFLRTRFTCLLRKQFWFMKQKLSQHVVNSIFYVIYFMFLAQSLPVFSGQLSFKGLNFTNRACFSVRVFKNKYRLFKVSSRSNENARDPTLNRELNRVHLMSMTSINI